MIPETAIGDLTMGQPAFADDLLPTGGANADPALFLPARALTGRQKAAIIVRLMLAEGASVPLQSLPDSVQTALTAEIGQMRTIDRATLAAVVDEFCTTIEEVGLTFGGGLDAAMKMLDGHLSPAATSRLRYLAGHAPGADPWDKLREMDVPTLAPAVAEESAEVAAVILSKLPVPKAAELLGAMPGERARHIAFSMSKTAGVAPDLVRRIGAALLAHLEVPKVSAFDGDPAERVGKILNVTSQALRDDVLKGLEEADGALAERVKRTIFTFAHIPTRILARDVPRVLRGIDQAQLVKALAGAKGPGVETAEFLLANMSQRMATNLREEMATVGRLKDKDVETAQTALVLAIRELVDTGELVMVVEEEEEE
mgnify:CR=1 FL=1